MADMYDEEFELTEEQIRARWPEYVKKVAEYITTDGVTDIHLTEGKNISIRCNGDIITVPILLPNHGIMEITKNIFKLQGWDKIDCAAKYEDKRLRLKTTQSMLRRQLVIRVLPGRAPDIDKLGYGSILKGHLLDVPISQGIVIVAGATGSGKSTLLAAILQKYLEKEPINMITAEHPAEYEFFDGVGICSQREIPDDVENFPTAIKGMLREDPDIILIGETRDPETAESTLQAAETGHLVFTTLHAPDIPGIIGRMLGLLSTTDSPENRLSNVLKGCIFLHYSKGVRDADYIWFDDETRALVRDKSQYYKLKDCIRNIVI